MNGYPEPLRVDRGAGLGSEILLEIDGSRNLDQRDGMIHENALVWVGRRETDIRQAPGRTLLAKRQVEASGTD